MELLGNLEWEKNDFWGRSSILLYFCLLLLKMEQHFAEWLVYFKIQQNNLCNIYFQDTKNEDVNYVGCRTNAF